MTRDPTGVKRGRNETCWCDSGLKFKRCHLNRAEQPKVQISDILAKLRKSSEHQSCSCPPAWEADCSGKIIKAHSLSRKSALANITESGHVYSLIPRSDRLFYKDDFSGQLLSAQKASTFTGFCGTHDRDIFLELDKHEFDGSLRRTFLASYRTLCRELFAKQGQINLFHDARAFDRGHSEEHQAAVQAGLQLGSLGATYALDELKNLKAEFDQALLSGDFSKFDYKNFHFKERPILVAAGGFNPTHDIEGKSVQNLENVEADSENIFFSLLPSPTGFWASFLWPRNYQLMADFVHAVQRRGPKAGTIYALALAYTENSFLRPSGWSQLSRDDKNVLRHLTFMGVADDDYRGILSKVLRLEHLYPTAAD